MNFKYFKIIFNLKKFIQYDAVTDEFNIYSMKIANLIKRRIQSVLFDVTYLSCNERKSNEET